jgi:hypothetical protein
LALLDRRQYHDDLPAFHLGFLFYSAEFRQILSNPLYQLLPKMLMGKFSASESQRYLGFVPIFEETTQVA